MKIAGECFKAVHLLDKKIDRMTISLFLKALVGAALVILIALLAKTKNYYLAGLVPLFPTFALIAHYIVGTGRSTMQLKSTILFGMWSLIPYFLYLLCLYLLIDKIKLIPALVTAAAAWTIAAGLLIYVWAHVSARHL